MTELYCQDKLNTELKKRRIVIAVGCVMPIIAIILVLVSCFVVNLETLLIFKIVDSIVLVICAWVAVFLFSFELSKTKNEITRLSAFLQHDRECLECTVSRIGEPKTVADGVTVYEVFVDDESRALFFETSFEAMSFSIGDTVKIEAVNNYIVAYEVEK